MTRVIHTGDTHLGYRQYHSPQRRRDFHAAFERVVEEAIRQDVDAVVHAGDLFHDRRPDLGDLLGTISVLRRLRDAGVPFLAIVGNHESTRTITAVDGEAGDPQWLDLFETLGLAVRLDASGHRVGDTVFYGLDHVPRSKRDDLDYEFAPPDAESAALVSHGLFTPFAHGNWDIEEVLAESNVGFDAVLLGDNHDPGVAEVDGTWVTYCGSTERCSAAEREDRGYNLVTFGEETTVSRKGIETRPFAFVDVELAGEEGTARVRERVREEAVEDAVVVVTVDGDGGQVTPAEVEALGDDLGALVTRVNDRREVAAPETEVDVNFADPDEAVRDRVRDLGLSEAARTLDETVRAGKVADTNVRDRVAEQVRDLLDDDPGAFERVPDDAETGDSDRDDATDAESTAVQADATDEGGDDRVAAVADGTAETPGAERPGTGPTEADGGEGETADGDGDDGDGNADGDSQVTMEDYL